LNAGMDRLKIGVIALTPGAGAGFVCSCLAGAFAETGRYYPAVLEIGEGGLFDSLAMDKHFAGRDYFSFFKAMNCGKSIRGRSNRLYGINWILRSPEEEGIFLDLPDAMRMVNHASGDVILCRITNVSDETLWRLLWDMDRILVVIDPLPSKMLAGYKLLCSLRTSGLPILYLINKMNGGVSRKEMLDYLKLKNLFYLPMIDEEVIYSSEYGCRFFYDHVSARSKLEKPMEDLIQALLAVETA
jgi:hypothetical protein